MVKVGLDLIRQKRGTIQGNKRDSGGIEKGEQSEAGKKSL